MRILPHSVSPNITMPLSEKSKSHTVGEASFLGKTKKAAVAPKNDFNSEGLISKQELMKLATDFKNGSIDRKEANARFVSAVINNSIQDKLGDGDREKITESIEKFFSEDQDFLHKLAENLSKLA